MTHFTKEQLTELATVFDLKRREDVLPVRDGVVAKDQKVWWRGQSGPEHVLAGKHWINIQNYPAVYQLKTPQTKVTYID